MNRSVHQIKLSRELNNIRSWVFLMKLGVLISLLALGTFLVHAGSLPLMALGMLTIGAMFAHAIELQHQCLHGTAVKSRLGNQVIGTLLGLPMFVSFSKYRVRHLKHHRDVGTPNDAEFFSYGRELEVLSPVQLVLRSFSLARYRQVGHDVLFYVFGTGPDLDGFSPAIQKRIRNEYLLSIGFFVGTAILSFFSGSAWFVTLWLIPAIAVAEPLHFWIELPEHYGCEKNTPSKRNHTRTIRGSLLSFWFTNGNNFHVEHHLYQHIPIDRLPSVHKAVQPDIQHYDRTYISFLRDRILNKKLEASQEAQWVR